MTLHMPMPPFDEPDTAGPQPQASGRLLSGSIFLFFVVLALVPASFKFFASKPLSSSLILLAVIAALAILVGRNVHRFWLVTKASKKAYQEGLKT